MDKNNQYAPERLSGIKMEKCKLETDKAIMDSLKPNIYSHPEMPRNVRFNLESDDTEDDQPENNRSLQYYCELCHEKTNTYRNHLKHHLLFHAMKAARKQIIHFWLEPDVNDPNLKCRACERFYNDSTEYRRHLRHVHRMPTKDAAVVRAKKMPSPSNNQYLLAFGPELDEINLYCRPCNRVYQTREKYRLHKSNTHGESLIKYPNVLPEWDNVAGFCPSCDYTFSSTEAFQRHCKITHKMDAHGPLDNQQPGLPDPLDPNNYCPVCDLKFKNRASHRRHCHYRHAIDLPPARLGPNADASLSPNPKDKNHHCRTCDVIFFSKMNYWKHIRLVHKLKPKALCKLVLPDIYDPNNYCSSCDKTFKKRHLFNGHLRRAHSLTIPKKKI